MEVWAFLPASVVSFGKNLLGPAPRTNVVAIPDNQSIMDAVGAFSPDAMLLGTTAVDSIERHLTVYARDHNLKTVAVIDERYGYRRRFSNKDDNLSYLPDIIALMDEECCAEATAEALPASRLRVTGSPILSHLAYNASAVADSAHESSHAFDSSWKQVTFLSEPFERDTGSAPGESGATGDFIGYTEGSVSDEILSALREIGRPTVVVEKLHPSDERVPKEASIGRNVYWKQVNGEGLWPLLRQSDAVIGMRSMALLEAALLGCRVASYQPDLIGENQCAAVRFGAAKRLDNAESLRDWLSFSLATEERHVAPPKDLPFVRPDADERVSDLVVGIDGAR